MTDNYQMPRLEREQDYVVIRGVPVNLNHGICCAPAAKIVQEFRGYPIKIKATISGILCEVSTSSILGLISLGAEKGTVLEIIVQDNPLSDKSSEELATRLYNGLTTHDFSPEFDRLKD